MERKLAVSMFGQKRLSREGGIEIVAKELCTRTPIYLQQYIRKQYEVRITIIAREVYAVRIDTKNKIDWRLDYQNHRYAEHDISMREVYGLDKTLRE